MQLLVHLLGGFAGNLSTHDLTASGHLPAEQDSQPTVSSDGLALGPREFPLHLPTSARGQAPCVLRGASVPLGQLPSSCLKLESLDIFHSMNLELMSLKVGSQLCSSFSSNLLLCYLTTLQSSPNKKENKLSKRKKKKILL